MSVPGADSIFDGERLLAYFEGRDYSPGKYILVLLVFSIVFGIFNSANLAVFNDTKLRPLEPGPETGAGLDPSERGMISGADDRLGWMPSVAVFAATALIVFAGVAALSAVLYALARVLGVTLGFAPYFSSSVGLSYAPLAVGFFATAFNAITYAALGDVSIFNVYCTPALGWIAYAYLLGSRVRKLTGLAPPRLWILVFPLMLLAFAWTVILAGWLYFNFFIVEALKDRALYGLGLGG